MSRKKSNTNPEMRSLETSGFYSDCEKSGTLHAALVRSPAATDKVRNVTLDNIPEGYYFFTAKDFPGSKKIEINKTLIKVFGYDDVSYKGEPLGIIAGPDEKIVNELLERVSVNFDIISLESALNKVMNQQKHSIAKLTKIQDIPLTPVMQKVLTEKNDTPRKNDEDEIIDEAEKTEETGNAPDFSDFLDEINNLPSLDAVRTGKNAENNTNKTIGFREIKSGVYQTLSDEEIEKLFFTNMDSTERQTTAIVSEIKQDDKSEDETEPSNFQEEKSKIKPQENNLISTESWSQKLSVPSWEETNGAFCYMDHGNLHVFAPTKWTVCTMKAISTALELPLEKIFIHKTKASGVYSKGLWRTTQLITQVALVAYLTQKPVKLILPQQEEDLYMAPGVNTKITYRTSVAKDGRINAMDVKIDVDAGACNPFAQEIIDRLSIAAFNYYRFDNIRITAQAHTSKNPPTSICIKTVDSQAFFAIENQLQKLSDQTHLFPEELRLANRNQKKAEYPISIPSDSAYETLHTAIKISDFNRKYASFHMDAIDRLQKNNNPFFALPLRGIGVATGFNVSEFHGLSVFNFNPKVEVTLSSKDKVIIHTIKPSEIVQDIWKNTASEILQIKKENIIIDSEFNINELPDFPEDSFSTIGTVNELIKKCCNDIQKKRFHQPLPITSKKGISPASRRNWNKESFSGIPFSNQSFATCVVEVELDTYSYSEKIKGIWIVVDCGELFDENAARKTILLEIQQELEMLVTGRKIPCDSVKIQFLQSKNKSGQIEALVHNTLPAAFTSALSLALATQLTKLPCTEKRLYGLIKDRETVINTQNQNGDSSANSLSPEASE
ncbi:MAG: xanthine dehydrogenase family protein molybdopterin-binding subunit [Treponema sp.]|nr:xanthine dehydrogenase family protein molybdopterin-binding subunit [Treponema sp.]